MSKLYSMVVVRLGMIAKTCRRSPSLALVWPWVLAGLVLSRTSGSRGVLRLGLTPAKQDALLLDTSSGSEMDIFREVVVCGNYPFDKLPFTPVMVADCGANVGYFSCLARVAFPEAPIYAWEPDARNFRRLSEQPILHTGKTTLANAAVSDHVGRVSLTGVGHGCEVKAELDGSEAVECIDFGAWWREHSRPYTLLKMDIEGHENTVLPTLCGSWQAPCAVFLETHAPHGQDDHLIKQLEADGFRVDLLRTHSLSNDERVFKEYFAVLA